MKTIYTLLITASLFAISTKSFAQPSVTTDSILQLSTCAGGSVIVPWTVTGGNFAFNNIFKAELSDAFGSFANPTPMGQVTWFTSGFMLATIPQNVTLSFFYKIRIIATNPIDTAAPCPNSLIITQIPQLNQIIALPPSNYICPGDTVTLVSLQLATSYSWSTGDTTATIQITQPGIYSVTTVDFLLCEATTSDTIWLSCTGITEYTLNNLLQLYPNPAKDYFTIKMNTDEKMNLNLKLYNVLGEEVYRTEMQTSNMQEKRIDVTALNAGIYFLHAESEGARIIKKIIIE